MTKKFIFKPKRILIYILAIPAVLGILIAVRYTIDKFQIDQAEKSVESLDTKPIIKSVNALGYIEPQGEVIRLAPTPTLGGGKITELYVKEGERVQAGQIIAILDNHNSRKADVERAKKEVEVAKANLAIVKAGAKQGAINKQKATIERLKASLKGKIAIDRARIARLEVELGNAEREFRRHEILGREGAISESDLDLKHLNLETARESLQEVKSANQETIDTLTKQIQEAQAELNRIAEIRDVDVQKASAEVERALSELQQAQADLELTNVRSPIQGQVLKVHTHPGENVLLEDGIVELGKTDQMIVVAEVYESDIGKVHLGQSVKIVSESGAFDGELKGKVSQIGLQIGKNDVLDTDPAADVDTRVVEVKILLAPEDSRRVASLTYSKVIVEILLDSAP